MHGVCRVWLRRASRCRRGRDVVYPWTMPWDMIIGSAVVVAALSVLVALVVWSRRAINRIARQGYRSARAILKGRNGE